MNGRTSVWTTDDEPREITVGDVWHLSVGGSVLKTCKVLALSQYTAKIMEVPYSHLQPTLALNRITFIEKVGP